MIKFKALFKHLLLSLEIFFKFFSRTLKGSTSRDEMPFKYQIGIYDFVPVCFSSIF